MRAPNPPESPEDVIAYLRDLTRFLNADDGLRDVRLRRVAYVKLTSNPPSIRPVADLVIRCPDHPQGACLLVGTGTGWERYSFDGAL